MVKAHISDDTLSVRFTIGEKIAGILRDFDVPLSAVHSARVTPDGMKAAEGVRAPGLAVPAYNKIGVWRGRGRRSAVVVRRGRPALEVRLNGHRYSHLLLSVDNAGDLVQALKP